MPVAIRSATADDEQAILALVRSERLNPTGLYWPNFVVAVGGRELVGAAQVRRHKDGSRELGSLVVDRSWRRQGVAARLVEKLLAQEPGQVFVITGQARAPYFAQWGFGPADKRRAPAGVKFNYRMGRIAGSLAALFKRRPINHLVILERTPTAPSRAGEPVPEDRRRRPEPVLFVHHAPCWVFRTRPMKPEGLRYSEQRLSNRSG